MMTQRSYRRFLIFEETTRGCMNWISTKHSRLKRFEPQLSEGSNFHHFFPQFKEFSINLKIIEFNNLSTHRKQTQLRELHLLLIIFCSEGKRLSLSPGWLNKIYCKDGNRVSTLSRNWFEEKKIFRKLITFKWNMFNYMFNRVSVGSFAFTIHFSHWRITSICTCVRVEKKWI